MEQHMQTEINRFNANEEKLRIEMFDLIAKLGVKETVGGSDMANSVYNTQLEMQLQESQKLEKETEEKYKSLLQTYEDEVKIRRQFEENINNLQAVTRGVEKKYKRATDEIVVFEISDKIQKERIST